MSEDAKDNQENEDFKDAITSGLTILGVLILLSTCLATCGYCKSNEEKQRTIQVCLQSTKDPKACSELFND